MTGKILTYIILSMLIPIFASSAYSQKDTTEARKDSAKLEKKKIREMAILAPIHKNVIKFNPTPMLLWSSVRNCTFSYERLIKKNQSMTLQVGFLELPALFRDTILYFININSRSKWGMNLAFEYRFYLSLRNRRPAPDGLYLAPYLSYYGFHFKNGLNIVNSDIIQKAEVSGDFNIINAGASLGYQFIFWKRVSLDLCLFGPSITAYGARLGFTGQIDTSTIENLDEEMVQELKERFPLIAALFSGETLRKTGYKVTSSFGFRYSVSIGFHF